jgi:hypothetical protein
VDTIRGHLDEVLDRLDRASTIQAARTLVVLEVIAARVAARVGERAAGPAPNAKPRK